MATEFSRPWLILCEGKGDKLFLGKLLREHSLVDFQVEEVGGRDSYKRFLIGAAAGSNFQNVKAILVIADNDDDAADSFASVKKQIDEAKDYGIPTAERIPARPRTAGHPIIVVLMIPIGANGNLETLCVEAALQKWPAVRQPLDQFTNATPAAGWGIAKQSKMRMQSIIATTCKDQPDVTLAGHFKQKEEYQFPIAFDGFAQIVDFLKAFGALVAA